MKKKIIWRYTYFVYLLVINGYIRFFSDEYHQPINGENQETGVGPAIIFLIAFGCLVGGFFIICIFGTLIFGIFDDGFRSFQRLICVFLYWYVCIV